MYSVLVADDEKRIRDVIREYAEFEGYSVAEASDGMDAVAMCRDREFDIIVIDIMMPRLDGFSACKEIRKYKDIPIIMLSARGEEYDKLFGFEIGIDDYVVKPFSPKELMARIKAVVNRNKASNTIKITETLSFGSLIIDTQGFKVFVDGSQIELTRKEYDLLLYLVKNKETAFSRKELLKAVWHYDHYDDHRTVDSHIKMLRQSLGVCRDYIVTIRGVGYKFEA